MGSWLQMRVRVPAVRRGAVADALLAMGATGLQEDHPGLHFEDGDGPVVPEGWDLGEAANPTTSLDLIAWFPGSEDPAELTAWLVARTGLTPAVERIADEDWNETWKASWEPGPLCRRVLVVPSWRAVPPLDDGQVVMRMDPGVAFGTGTHPTTRTCAALLDELLATRGTDVSVLDVGTGTGVLAVAARLLGVTGAVVGVDTDAKAIEAAVENAALNGVAIDPRVGGIEAAADDGPFDVVLANLLAPLLIELADGLFAATAAGGSVIASGILCAQADEVVAALAGAGLRLAERRDGPAWSALRMERD